jgi:hypothetical protein
MVKLHVVIESYYRCGVSNLPLVHITYHLVTHHGRKRGVSTSIYLDESEVRRLSGQHPINEQSITAAVQSLVHEDAFHGIYQHWLSSKQKQEHWHVHSACLADILNRNEIKPAERIRHAMRLLNQEMIPKTTAL